MTTEQIETMLTELKSLTPQDFLANQEIFSRLKYMIDSKQRAAEDWQTDQDRIRRNELKQEISFEEPNFESFDEDEDEEYNQPRDGSAVFATQEQCDEFIKLMNKQSYYYLYTIDWQGPGPYICKTSWDIRCGETEYTAHFTKSEEK